MTFTPGSVTVGDNLSVTARGFDVGCNDRAVVDLVDAISFAFVANLGSTFLVECTEAFSNVNFRVPSVAAGANRYRVRVTAGGSTSGGTMTFISSATLTVTSGSGTRVLSGTAQCPNSDGPSFPLPGATVEVSSGSTIVATTIADGSGNWSVNVAPGTYSVRYLATDGSGFICGASASVPSDGTSGFGPAQGCIDLHNHSILHAVTLTPGSAPTLEHICKQGQSLWFRVAVSPNARLVARLTGRDGGRLPTNYDLVMYRDPFQAMKPVATTTDLTSQFAGDSFGGDSFGGDSFGGDSFGGDSFGGDSFGGDSFGGDSFGGDSFGGDSFGGDSFGGDSFGGDSFGGDSFGGDSFGGDSFGGDSFGGDSFGGDSFGGDSFGGDSFGGNPSLGGMSPAEFAHAIQRSVIGVSAHNGTQREGVWHNTWDNFTDVSHNTGWFYLRVRGRGGVYSLDAPAAISTELFTGVCNSINPGLGVSSLSIPGGSFHTLILTNTTRFPGQDTSALITSLNQLAAEPTITGAVVDLGLDSALSPAYVQWDGHRECPTAANVVTDGIKTYITRFRAAHPETQSIVFAGPDAALPFRRVPDLSTLAKESMYVPPVFDASATQASLRLGYFLTQDFYVSSHPIEKLDHDLFLPDSNMATGRLIETVPQIGTMVDAYRSAGGRVTPTSAVVTGYNFFSSSAVNIRDQLAQTGKVVNSTDSATRPSLIQPGTGLPTDPTAWRASDLRDALATNPGLISLNAHGTRPDTIKAADYSPLRSNELLTMAAGMPGLLRNSFIWSEACHSSFSIPDGAAIPGVTPTPEIAEVLAQLGATVVGGTGYQYGDTDTIQYTTQIMVNLTTELRYGAGAVPVGQALVNAKLNYANSIIDFKGIHEKSILESTLYGIPDFSVDLGPSGRLTRPTETPLFGTGDLHPVSSFPGSNPNLNLRTVDLNLNFAAQRNDVLLANLAGGSTTASYFSLGGLTQANPNEPLLPRFVTPLHLNTSDNTLVRGAVFLGGNFIDIPGFTPLTAQPSYQLRDPHRPFLSETEFPQRLERINYFSGEHLVLTPAQYTSGIGPDGQRLQSGTERAFSNINTRLYYSSLLTQTVTANGQTFQAVLAGPPGIISQKGVPNGSNINFEVLVSALPNIGVQDVFITWTNTRLNSDGAGSWSSIPLTQDPPTSPSRGLRWTGSLPIPSGANASDLRYIIQAVSGAGLVTVSTNFGAFFTPQVLPTNITPRKTTALNIVPPTPSTAIWHHQPITVAAQLTDTSNNSGIAGKKVVFNLGGERGVGFTNSSGLATAQLQVTALPGAYSVDASFDEDDGDLGSDAKAPLTITKESTNLTLAVTPTAAPFHGTIHVDSTLTDAVGRRLREQSVFFLIADSGGVVQQAFQDETDFSGKVHTDIPLGLPAGSYTVTAAFAGVIQLPAVQTIDLTNTRYLAARSAAVPFTVGRNFSLQLDGSTGYATAPAAPKLNIIGDWTVESWFKDEDPNGFNHDFRQILAKGDRDVSPEAPYFVVIGNNHLLAGVRTGGTDFPIDANLVTLGLDPKQWHHVAVTFGADLNVLNLWLDGVHISYKIVPGHSTGNALPLQIGRGGPATGKYWMGKLDDVRVWNIARTGADISSSFQNELVGAPAGLVGNWRFDEGSGTVTSDAGVPPAADATLSGGASFSTDVHP